MTRSAPPARHDDGAALVEFALVVVLLLTLLLGTISYGLILGLHQSVTHAASAAARAAIVVPAVPGQDREDAIRERVNETVAEQLAWLGTKREHVLPVAEPVVIDCPGSTGRCVRVVVAYPYDQHPIIPTFPFVFTPEWISSTAVLELEPIP